MRSKTLAKIAYKLLKPSRPPDFIIGEPYEYMHRWYILPRNKYFNIYWHQYYGDDSDEATHDHPWWSISLCLKGIITEQIGKQHVHTTRTITKGDIIFRSAEFAHKLSLPPQINTPTTLFITGPVVREWGFHCPKGWRHWKIFTKYSETGTSARKGIGCGEV